MKKFILGFALLLLASPVWAQNSYNWQFVGWYGGGTYPNVEFDPSVQNRVYLTSDVAGIWRSDDLGNHWYFVNNGLGGLMVSQIAIAPTNSNILYAATNAGVYYSTNAGQSWNASDTANNQITFIRPQNYRSLAIDPKNPEHVCVGTQSEQIFCSSNYGQSWQSIALPISSALQPNQPIPAMFISRDSSTLFVAFSQLVAEYTFSNGAWIPLGKFTNGITDMIEDKFLNRIYIASGNTFSFTQEYMLGSWATSAPVPNGVVYRIALSHPTNNTVQVYASWWSSSMYQGGVLQYQQQWSSWLSLDTNFYPDQISDPTRIWASISTVQESLKVDPYNLNVLFRTDNWGAWRSDYAGYSWNEKIIGAPDTVATDIALASNGNIYEASMDDGLLESTNSGGTFTSVFPTTYANNTAGTIWRVAAIGSTPRIVATSSPWNVNYNQVIVSENGGQTFSVVTNGLPQTRPTVNTVWGTGYPRGLAVDPNNPKTIYMGIDGDDGGGLFVSNDGGYTWNHTPGQPAWKEIYHGLAVDPVNSNNIIWGAVGNNGGVYLSTDKGNSFNLVFSEMDWVFNVAVDPNGLVYAGGSWSGPAVFVSDSTEKNYSLLKQFSGGVGGAVDGIAVNPKNPNMIAVSTVNWGNQSPCMYYLSTDKGKTWTAINGNLPAGTGSSLMDFDPKGQYLYITRYAGCVYRINLSS